MFTIRQYDDVIRAARDNKVSPNFYHETILVLGAIEKKSLKEKKFDLQEIVNEIPDLNYLPQDYVLFIQSVIKTVKLKNRTVYLGEIDG